MNITKSREFEVGMSFVEPWGMIRTIIAADHEHLYYTIAKDRETFDSPDYDHMFGSYNVVCVCRPSFLAWVKKHKVEAFFTDINPKSKQIIATAHSLLNLFR